MDNPTQTLSPRESSEVQNFSATSTSGIENGSFETADFEDWNTIGDTSIETKDLGIFPTEGTYQALITSGESDAGGSVIDSDLEEFLDLASGSLDNFVGSDAYEGSAIKQTLTLEAGDVVSFDWNFLTDENTPDTDYNDTAFLSVNGFTLELADTGSDFIDANNVDGFNEQTDFQTLTFTVAKAGTYTMGFGVVDVGDDNFDSGLAIDNITVQPSSGEGNSYSANSGSGSNLTLGEDGFSDGTTESSESGLTLGEDGFV